MPADDDTRYRGTAPPPLETLQAMLESVASVHAYRNKSGTRTRLILEIDADKLHGKGHSCYATGEQIAEVLRDTVSRMVYFDRVTADYSREDRKGATAADIAAFIQNEMKHIKPNGLASTMQFRMFSECIHKLTELGVWRVAADAKRFQKEEDERKRQDKMREEAMRAKAEADARMKEEQEKGKSKDENWKGAFEDAFKDFEESTYRYGFDFYSGARRQQYEEPPKPKASHKGRLPWYAVLEVSPQATDAEIIKAYRRLVSKYQPRTSEDALDVSRTEKMKAINTARDEVYALRGIK